MRGMDALSERLAAALQRLIETALLPELTFAEAALGLGPEDVAAFQRADVERSRARYRRE
jgi:hypothetical protein